MNRIIEFDRRSLTVMASVLLSLSMAHAAPMTGAYIVGDGWNTTNISQFKQSSGKPLAVVNFFTSFDYNWSNQLKYQTSNIVAQGGTPMITLMPVVSARRVNLLPEIVAGQWNTYLDAWIAGLKSWQNQYPVANRPTIMLRFAHEFNGNWYPWGNDPNNLRAAWRYVHARFAAAGVHNVEWVWCINNVSVDSYNDITRYYPGDDVVDWTSIDGYNWGSNYSFSQWKSFDETFSVPYLKLVTTFANKPIVLAEVASAEPSDTPRATYGQTGNNTDANESKAAWVADMYNRIPAQYLAIKAVSWFNINKELSWSLNGVAQNGAANTGMDQYRQAIATWNYSGVFSPMVSGTMTWTNPHLRRRTVGVRPQESWRDLRYWQALWTDKTQPKRAAALRCNVERQVSVFERLPTPVGMNLLEDERSGLARMQVQMRRSRLDARLDEIAEEVATYER